MKIKHLIFTLLAFCFSVVSFGMVQEVPSVDLTDPTVIIGIATPLVTYAVVWIVKAMTNLKGVYTLIVVAIVAGLFTSVTNFITEDLNWFLQVLLGLLSVFLDQLYKSIKYPL